ncbi:MAG TPA: D-aminoacylase [Candidatus Dormibacteraeota bacterium]|nr:D-aminoacylase [Candidatus Dormibacteraeota bacterium]
MRRLILTTLLTFLSVLPLFAQQSSLVIINAQLADGTGAPLRRANLRITGPRITKIGDFKPAKSDQVLDAKGLVLAPGFIDIHNHSTQGLESDPLAESQIAQGITSLILGADGDSPWPILPWLEARQKNPAAVNVAVLAGHATIRELVLGKDFRRTATPEEIEKMATLTAHAMHEGAIGLSSGLEYDVASYSNTDEVVAMATEAAKRGGFYMTHIRDEGNKSLAALKEEIEIGKRARIPIEHSHIKLGTVDVWHKAPEYIAIINDARNHGVDFLADCYPYEAWHSGIKVLMPDKQYQNPASVEKAIADNGGPESVAITEFKPNPSYAGHTLGQLAKINNISYVEMYSRIVREGDAADTEASIIGHSMVEDDVKAFYQLPWVMVASDGGIGSEHPRGAGTFPRVLGLYVREKKWITLPEAIRKMTSLPAKRLKWKDRGTLKIGNFADLVLFNPDTVLDRSTFEKPFELPTGIEKVFVNGQLTWDSGHATGAKSGTVLTVGGKIVGAAK